MKTIAMCLLILVFSVELAAQERRAHIGLQAGPSFPLGQYRSKKLPDGSFTQAGLGLALEGAWFFNHWLGAGGSAGLYYHPVDVGSLGYEKVLEDPFMNDVYIRSDPYRNYAFYAGLFFRHGIVPRLTASAKALGGVMYSQTPYQLYKAHYYLIGEKWFEITAAGDYEASFLAGAGLTYELPGCIGFTVNSDFTWNRADFDFVTSGGQLRTDQKVITFLNITAGFIVKIIPK